LKRLLVDVNVVLDVLLDRAPHAETASSLWAAGERGRCRLLLPAHAVTTVFYLAAKARDAKFARSVVADLVSIFEVAPVDAAVLRRALALEMADFEDAVAAAAAEAAGADALVTRNLDDFEASPLPAVDPPMALAWLEVEAADPQR
jgi:predicted nucleic acid-binding protein